MKLVILLGLAMALVLVLDAQEVDRGPAAVVDAFHEALASSDVQRGLELLDPGVVIFESGGAELSRDEYVSHHLRADMEFAAATESKTIDRRSGRNAEYAWVLTRSETGGVFHDRAIDSIGTETMLLQHSQEGWKIAHIHWSSHSRKKPH